MSTTLDPELRLALSDRIRYYKDLGIYDFYRREVTPSSMAKPIAATRNERKSESVPALLESSDPASGLRLRARS